MLMLIQFANVSAAETFTYDIIDNSGCANVLALGTRTPDNWMYDEIKQNRMRVLFNKDFANYCFNVWYKFDLSGVNAETLKKAELLLMIKTATSDTSYFELYDIENTNWTAEEVNNSASLAAAQGNEKYKEYPVSEKAFASKYKIAVTSLGYEEEPGANYSIDITDYLIEKLNNGCSEAAFCLATSNNYINCALARYGKLRITNTSNLRPVITTDLPDAAAKNKPLAFNVSVSDNTDFISSVTAAFDGETVFEKSDLNVTEYSENITIPSEKAVSGSHTVTVTAYDSYGASAVYEKTVRICAIDVINADLTADGNFTVTVKNITDAQAEVVAAVCVFDDNYKKSGADVKGGVILPGETLTFTPSVSAEGSIIEAYLWEGTTFAPITEKKVINR